jgi:DNA-binding HxlR family transcriptional regulator
MRQREEKQSCQPKIYSEVFPRVKYSLTEIGKSLSTMPDDLSQLRKQVKSGK